MKLKGMDGAARNFKKMWLEWGTILKGLKPHLERNWWVPFSHAQVNLPVEAARLSPYWVGHALYFSAWANVVGVVVIILDICVGIL